MIKSIAFNHSLAADLSFHAISESPIRLLYSNISNRNMNIFSYWKNNFVLICAWENEPFSSTNYVSGIPFTMPIIREWDCQEGNKQLFNCHYYPCVLWDIFRKLDSTQPAHHKTKQNIEVSEQVTIQTFRNARDILQYKYFNIFKHIHLLRDRLKNSLPIFLRQCLQRTGKYDTNCAVLISHSSSCDNDRDQETL